MGGVALREKFPAIRTAEFHSPARRFCAHPRHKALAQIAREAGVPLAEPQNFAETAGRGVKADVGGAKILGMFE